MNCIECYSLKILLENILNILSGHELTPENNYSSFAKCDCFSDFVQSMQRISKVNSVDSYVIVLENAERLRDMDHTVLPSFMTLKELTKLNICTILVSSIVFEKFSSKSGLPEPITINVAQYNQEELLKIMALDYNYNKTILIQKFGNTISKATVEDLGRCKIFLILNFLHYSLLCIVELQ